MRERRKTRRVTVGGIEIGGGAPVSVQSMTTVDTKDLEALLRQIHALEDSGCDIVRVALYDRECAGLVPRIVAEARVPIVADVHFDAQIAVRAIEGGIHKVRINPGNVGSASNVRRVADAARSHGVPIRVGANGGSLPAAQKEYGPEDHARALVDAAMHEVRLLEAMHFEDIVISLKSSDVPTGVEAVRQIAGMVPYPLHLGVTEAGTREHAMVKSAVGIGTLLMEGIGDTIRVSISGDPLQEVLAGRKILQACGYEKPHVNIISCPTCARSGLDVEAAALRVEEITAHCKQPITVAVMGCAVNGPGEAKRADLGIAGAPAGIVLFEHGRVIRTEPTLEAAYRALEDAIERQQKGAGAPA